MFCTFFTVLCIEFESYEEKHRNFRFRFRFKCREYYPVFPKNDSVQVSLVLSNKSDAYVLERAHRLGVPSNVFPKEDWIAGDEILAILQEYRIDFVVLAGFLVRVPDLLLHAYPDKIINIHPALLPKYGGKGMYGDRVHEAVVAAGEKESGITIHYINEHYDEGNTIFKLLALFFRLILRMM